MPAVHGYAHVAITVTDLDRAVDFYTTLLGAPPVGRIQLEQLDRQLFAVGGGQILGVTAYPDGDDRPFDPTVAGLDHIGLRCADRDEVLAWQRHVAEAGLGGDFQDVDFGSALMVKDPDGNQIEFFAGPVPG